MALQLAILAKSSEESREHPEELQMLGRWLCSYSPYPHYPETPGNRSGHMAMLQFYPTFGSLFSYVLFEASPSVWAKQFSTITAIARLVQ